jgi:sulfur carrier protein
MHVPSGPKRDGSHVARTIHISMMSSTPAICRLTVNGEPLDVPLDTTVASLLESMEVAGKRVAVERNGEIVPRSRHASVELAPGDRIEIVVAVGGG